jgi:dihydroneopterin aldolase
MTLLLVGVTGPNDAERALLHGADVIHVVAGRDPQSTADIARATIAAVGGRTPVSAATGSATDAATIWTAATLLADAGIDSIEVRTPPGLRRFDSVRALTTLARRIKMTCTIFAEEDLDPAVLTLIAQSGFAGVTLDTQAAGARILDHKDIAKLADVVEAVRARGLALGFAGALETPDVPRLLLLAPDVLCLRAAAFNGAKTDTVRALVPRAAPEQSSADAERDPRRRARGPAGPTDRVFVRDFVLPMRIGAYAREHGTPQTVRFDVDVEVLRAEGAPEDMRDVFSYDIITDSIRLIARNHVALVETIAERIAAVLLGHPRVVSATVRVEKLDTGPGGVGIEITRRRTPEAATVRQLYPVGEADPKAAT